MSTSSSITGVPPFDLERQVSALRPRLDAAIADVLASHAYCSGPVVDAFEPRFAEFSGLAAVACVNSGTSALHAALVAAGVGPGDEVITTPFTFIATAWAISYVGAKPVFVDIDPVSYTIDPQQVAAAVTDATKAVLPVHLYGQPADMAPLVELCQAKGLALIEDAAQAHGARYDDQPVGSFGAAACFSFYPSKNLGGCGEGGAVGTNDAAFADRVRLLRDHAQRPRGTFLELGFNFRMDGIQAAVLGVKLDQLPAWNARRREVAAAYREGLAGVDGITLPVEVEGRHHVYHQYTVRHADRDRFRAGLQERGVGTGMHYPCPVHLQPAYAHLGQGEGSLPKAEQAAREVVCLPMFPELTDPEIDYVIDAVRASA